MSELHFLPSRRVPAFHPEWVSALWAGPAAVKDILATETELTPRCQHTHVYEVIGRMEEKLCTSSRDAVPSLGITPSKNATEKGRDGWWHQLRKLLHSSRVLMYHSHYPDTSYGQNNSWGSWNPFHLPCWDGLKQEKGLHLRLVLRGKAVSEAVPHLDI